MADFDLTQTDQQVQNILNDAQGAMGASAQTTLTTEYVMLKDTNGVYHKILKSSFTEAIRDVLAGLLVNNDKGTTINQIAAIASGDFGSITPANLASVLGGLKTEIVVPANSSVEVPSAWAGKIMGIGNLSYTSFLSVFSIVPENDAIQRVSQTSGGLSINNEAQSDLHISKVGTKLMIQNNTDANKVISWRVL